MSQSVNLSLGLGWTGSHATPSQPKTDKLPICYWVDARNDNASFSFIWAFLPLLPSFPLSLSLHCPISVSLFLSVYLLFSSGGFCGIGQQHCVGGDYVWSADSDLTFSMLSLRLKPALVDSCPPKLPLCSCYFFCCCFNASYAFHREGTSRHMRCGNFPALVIFHDQFVVFSVCVCMHAHKHVHSLAI